MTQLTACVCVCACVECASDLLLLVTELSAMVRGAEQKDLVTVVDYQEKELETIVKEYFKNVTK